MHTIKSRKNGPLKTFQKGRVCKKRGCKNKLSVYNAQEYCRVHAKEALDD